MEETKEMAENALPVEITSVKEIPKSADTDALADNLLIVEITNPNPFRIPEAAIAFYDDESELPYAYTEDLIGYIEADSSVTLLAWNKGKRKIDTVNRMLCFSEYGIYIPDGSGQPSLEIAGSEVLTDEKGCSRNVEVMIHADDICSSVNEDGKTEYVRPQVSVIFYLGGEAIGGGYKSFNLNDNDVTVSVPVYTDVTDYDDYEINVYSA